MRLKSEIWVSAHIRLANANGAIATVISKGDADAGAIYIQTRDGNGEAKLYGPTQAENPNDLAERYWRFLIQQPDVKPHLAEPTNPIDDYLARQRRFDPDIWVVEIEDRDGRHFLGENLVDT